ncbi:MAG: MBL fold metallo-hydrolase [Ilumatobacteraceae bacterium]|nr:MBL fold metallo-hydrolase [Ilumatobacteraceae bacterium]
MTDLLALSTRIIDESILNEPTNRISNELSEIAPDLAMVESFSHCVAWDSGDGLVCFDTSGVNTGSAVVSALQFWRPTRFHSLVYTHGHADHVGGSPAFGAHARDHRQPLPHVVGHENIAHRFARYRQTNDWNLAINHRQFGGISRDAKLSAGGTGTTFIPHDTLEMTQTFSAKHSLQIANDTIELNHARGETDDHLWAWMPERKWLASGDFVIWNFPNAGNPQKVQRYPIEWAAALRDMITRQPELLLPAHGLPIEGKDRIALVLGDIATALESLSSQVLNMMNAGETLNTIIHTAKVSDDLVSKPYLRPFYDEPEFVVHNLWRQFGGWWDGAASRLKPSPDDVVARELADLSGGAIVLARRAQSLAESGDLRLACHLVDFAGWAAPEDVAIHAIRADIYKQRRDSELSLMSKGIYMSASRESRAVVKQFTTQ